MYLHGTHLGRRAEEDSTFSGAEWSITNCQYPKLGASSISTKYCRACVKINSLAVTPLPARVVIQLYSAKTQTNNFRGEIRNRSTYVAPGINKCFVLGTRYVSIAGVEQRRWWNVKWINMQFRLLKQSTNSRCTMFPIIWKVKTIKDKPSGKSWRSSE